jgi:hypothetical protein
VCRYEGDWASALYEGHGSETFAKGSTYHGQYSSGLRHGWGVCRFFNGDYYEGQWSKGLRDGCGMQQVRCGAAGGQSGKRTEQLARRLHCVWMETLGLHAANGVCSVSVSNVEAGALRPRSTFHNTKGRRASCRYLAHIAAAAAAVIVFPQCTDDSNYCGQYRHGKRHGYGVYSFPNGDQYLGEYEDDIPQVCKQLEHLTETKG